ncbi:BBL_G0042490.mRNA.1.CDS.1 [Saccharomyces cerevisiae]|nr:BBL_G0042490.mRNA.1.CDS.1 [Saccharomyces cerevisiae]CAI7283268.1 BBL_G0042490.mRNA.1.CDS.1 [Saccharomyces cerevisiae]
MGLFSFDGGRKESQPPNTRSQRKLCWESRDAFFQCLDKADILDAMDPKNSKSIKSHCKVENEKFEENCAHSWIKYFKEKRVIDFKREETIKRIEQEAKQRERNQ